MSGNWPTARVVTRPSASSATDARPPGCTPPNARQDRSQPPGPRTGGSVTRVAPISAEASLCSRPTRIFPGAGAGPVRPDAWGRFDSRWNSRPVPVTEVPPDRSAQPVEVIARSRATSVTTVWFPSRVMRPSSRICPMALETTSRTDPIASAIS